MFNIKNFATVALVGLIGAPLSAQIVVRSDSTIHERVEAARRRAEASRRIESASARRDGRSANRIPPGHLPPRGMCRVWIDGVPPGQQPPVTDCVTAERNRTANSRVIYGDRESFPGKGKGKFKNRDRDVAQSCTLRDAVVVDGRVINVCRDSTLRNDRRGRRNVEFEDDDDRWDDDREKLSKSEKQARKAARKANRGRG